VQVPDHVPCAAVITAHESRSEILRAGVTTVTKLCSDANTVTLEEMDTHLSDTRTTPVAVGANIELFQFRPTMKFDKSADMFRFLSLISLDSSLCNPVTVKRRQARRWNAMLPPLIISGVFVSAVVGATVAYRYHPATRQLVDDCSSSVKAWFGTTKKR
jgi:hypothetical protein